MCDPTASDRVTLRQRVPEPLVGPLGGLSLLVGLAGLVVGYILTMVGLTSAFALNGLQSQGLPEMHAWIVTGIGIVCVGVAYAGYRGFMLFAT